MACSSLFISSSYLHLIFLFSSSSLRLLSVFLFVFLFVLSSSPLRLPFVFPSSSIRLFFVFSSSSLRPIFVINLIASMSKIVVCFDGTGNSYQGNTSDTNIVKLYQKLDRTTKTQFHYYQRKSLAHSLHRSNICHESWSFLLISAQFQQRELVLTP